MHVLAVIWNFLTGEPENAHMYAFTSGPFGLYVIPPALYIFWRKHNCDTARCHRLWRNGHELYDDKSGITHHLCRKCHPGAPKKGPSREHLLRIFHETEEGTR